LKNLRLPKEIDCFPVPLSLFNKIDVPGELVSGYQRPGETVFESLPINTNDGELRVIVYWKGLWRLPLWEDPRGFLVLKDGRPVTEDEARLLMEYLYVFIVFREKTSHRIGLETFIAGDMKEQYQFFGDIIRDAKVRFAGEGIEKYLEEKHMDRIPVIRQAFDQLCFMADELKRLNQEYIKTGTKLLQLAQTPLTYGQLQLDTLKEVYDQFIHDSRVVQEFFNIYINAEPSLGRVYSLIAKVLDLENDQEARKYANLAADNLKKMKSASFDYKRKYMNVKTDNSIYEAFQEDKLKRFVFPLIRNYEISNQI
jgi:hypothetical protein